MTDRKPARYLYILPSLVSGGAEHQTINHVNFLYENVTQHTHILLLHNEDEIREELRIPSSNIHRLGIQPQRFNHWYVINPMVLRHVTTINGIIAEYGIDCVISVLNPANFIARLSKIFSFGRKSTMLITYYRNVYFQLAPLTSFPRKVFNAFMGWLARLDDGTIFISEAVRKDISSHRYTSPRYRVIFNSLPKSTPDPVLAVPYLEAAGVNESTFTMLFPGRLHMQKGHLAFLDVVAELIAKEAIPPKAFYLFIAGSGPLQEVIEERARVLELMDYVTLLGNIPNRVMLSLMGAVRLVTVPSVYEGFGNVAIEALMCGATTLTSTAGGLDEIIDHKRNGYKFPVGDYTTCFNLLRQLYIDYGKLRIDPGVATADFENRFTLISQIEQITTFAETIWKDKCH